jgi:hypothetical protein
VRMGPWGYGDSAAWLRAGTRLDRARPSRLVRRDRSGCVRGRVMWTLACVCLRGGAVWAARCNLRLATGEDFCERRLG